jgi:PAS domain S-box-containing protein
VLRGAIWTIFDQVMEQFNDANISFETIFNHVNEGVLIVNSSGSILLANPKLAEMFGYQENELDGMVVEKLIPSVLAHRHVQYRSEYMKNPVRRPMGKNMSLHGKHKTGKEFPIEISLSYYNSNSSLFVIAFIIDISDRFDQQAKIQRMNNELKSLNESLEKKVAERTLVLKEALHELEVSRDELSQALENEKGLNELKSRFVSTASHEFRTPLSTILSSVSLIQKYTAAEDQEKREKHILKVKNAVSGLTEILNDFLSLGKLEEGKMAARPALYDVFVLVKEVVSDINSIVRSGQTITFNSGTFPMMIDRQLLRNVMFNLLSNAIKFSPEGAVIDVQVSVNEEEVVIAVKDQGIGISDVDMKNLFGRFFRGANAVAIPGTGLGLNIVTKYLELMQGTITCTSELNEGSTFYIYLPKSN